MKRPRLKVGGTSAKVTQIQYEIRPNNRMFGINKQAWVDLWYQGLQGTMVTFKTKPEAERRFKKLPRELRKLCTVLAIKYSGEKVVL